MDGIERSEKLMRRGWWSEAEASIQREDVSPANRKFQSALLECRKECAEFAAGLDLLMPLDHLERVLLERFDKYTVYWYFKSYAGEGSLSWRRSARANAQTD